MPGLPQLRPSYDFVILGGGHAGLQAALKAALLQYSSVVLSRGPKYGRSFYAPRMENIPGFPDGVSGHILLDKQVEALRRHEASASYVAPARVATARTVEGGFEVDFDWLAQRRTVRGKVLVLALGVVDRIPLVGGAIEPIFPWANAALFDFCLLCDGHDLPGKRVAVVGDSPFAVRLAIDLLHFRPASMELLTHGRPLLAEADPSERAKLTSALEEHRIPVHESEMIGFDGIREKRWTVKFADGSSREYDRGFSGLEWYDMHSEIARSLGATFDSDQYVVTDEDCRVLSAQDRNPIPGLYCIGDLRNGWNQIPEAWAMAERAVIHAYSYYL